MLINCCGFESIPPDIGTYYSIKQLNEKNIKVFYIANNNLVIVNETWSGK